MKIRSPKHLKFVARHPCSIMWDGLHCNQKPVDAHHLMKIGGRGMSLKESDEWTVPLCRHHHHEVTDYGDEEIFWKKHGYPYEWVKLIAKNLARMSPDKKIRESAV